MELRGKLVGETEIKSQAEVIYETFSSKQYNIANICPDKIVAVELHQGDWGQVASVLTSHYTLDGRALIAEEMVEEVDREKKSITFNVFGGDLMNMYKTFKMIVQVVAKDEQEQDDQEEGRVLKMNLVKWTIEYEKLNKNIPDPNILLDFGIAITKDVDAHYLHS